MGSVPKKGWVPCPEQTQESNAWRCEVHYGIIYILKKHEKTGSLMGMNIHNTLDVDVNDCHDFDDNCI